MADNTKFVCAAGMDSGDKRMEAGDLYVGSKKSLPWLVEQGYVVEEGSDEHRALKDALAAAEVAGEGEPTVESEDDQSAEA